MSAAKKLSIGCVIVISAAPATLKDRTTLDLATENGLCLAAG
jgi:hypothetical protein